MCQRGPSAPWLGLILISSELSFYPRELSIPAGETATFFCNISTVNFSHSEYSLNWYREVTNSNQSEKIAELNGNTQRFKRDKFHLIENNSIVKMQIKKLNKNDSGLYYCGLIAFSFSNKVMESKKSQLTVTGMFWRRDDEQACVCVYRCPLLDGLRTAQLCSCVDVTPSKNNPLIVAWQEGKPPAVTVYTVDYGVLEFQQDQKTKALDESFPPDQTEYATIVFSEEKPVTPERGKKTKNKRTSVGQRQHCLYPLYANP
uniref:Ig-like domain-containing protein n=1 Tax=Pelusios castaneus TaxID=367368 RepID=A0A8C8RV72_9SAUR